MGRAHESHEKKKHSSSVQPVTISFFTHAQSSVTIDGKPDAPRGACPVLGKAWRNLH